MEFFNPNHDYCVAETGYLADKDGPTAPDRECSLYIGFLIDRWNYIALARKEINLCSTVAGSSTWGRL